MSNTQNLKDIAKRIAAKHSESKNAPLDPAKPLIKARPHNRTPLIKLVKDRPGFEWQHEPGDKYVVEGVDLMGMPVNANLDNMVAATQIKLKVGTKYAWRNGTRYTIARVEFGEEG